MKKFFRKLFGSIILLLGMPALTTLALLIVLATIVTAPVWVTIISICMYLDLINV